MLTASEPFQGLFSIYVYLLWDSYDFTLLPCMTTKVNLSTPAFIHYPTFIIHIITYIINLPIPLFYLWEGVIPAPPFNSPF